MNNNRAPPLRGYHDPFGPVPTLPLPGNRWTAQRKASVIKAVRGGWVPIEDVCQLYSLSVDEFLAWERDIDRHGLAGLHAKRLRFYRDTAAIVWR